MGIGDEVIDSASDKDLFHYRDYGVKQFAPYLTVTYTTVMYTGGAHPISHITADNFDTRSGALLTFGDVFGAEAPPVLVKAVQATLPDTLAVVPDAGMIAGTPFRFTEQGVEFIFNEYEIASYADGIIYACIPWQTVSPLLLIDPPEVLA